jgi:hypothetical protein
MKVQSKTVEFEKTQVKGVETQRSVKFRVSGMSVRLMKMFMALFLWQLSIFLFC